MAASDRELDVVLFGATGYTGEHTARALSKMAAPGGAWQGVRWAIAGRSSAKLAAIDGKWSLSPTATIVADTTDAASLVAMCVRARVVMNATGPYRFYGEAVVAACVESGADYVDLCGEPEFIDRCLLKFDATAREAGVAIVHSCAFDSVPADIGTLFTAMQFNPPALCAHADMYHTVNIKGKHSPFHAPHGASGHATTFYAAVHGFGALSKTRAQRKALLAAMEEREPGSATGPPPLGPKLRVKPGPAYNKAIGGYSFRFMGSDAAVVRTSQRALKSVQAGSAADPSEPYLTPQFGASFLIKTKLFTAVTMAAGAIFNVLCGFAWGRKLLLSYPQVFSLGVFSEEGPSEAMLEATAWRTVFLGRGWAECPKARVLADPEAAPQTGFDRAVTVSVSGPEPGYKATAQMFASMARFVLENKASLPAPAHGGVFTPGAFVGAGGRKAVSLLVSKLREVGVAFEVDKPLKAVKPKPRQATGGAKRPAWQTALNGIALVGWTAVLAGLLGGWGAGAGALESVLGLATLLEFICAFEVVQIVLGMARGNVVLGVILHYTRLLQALCVIPAVGVASLFPKLVLLAWSVTEVCRYPMFLLPSSGIARAARYAAPAATFPLGVLAEAACSWLALGPLRDAGAAWWLRAMVALVIPTNLLGGLAAYGGVLKKAKNSFGPKAKQS